MIYHDLVYGKCDITEPVVLELINSPALKRLKGIHQAGYAPLSHESNLQQAKSNNRYSHSLGVYLLLRKYGAPLEEQVSGLIHDVSHSAFSHMIDYVLESGNGKEQNHQDNSHNNFLKSTEIPEILIKYKFNLEYLLDDKNFPLKEMPLPDLCADRIDYLLRDATILEEILPKEASAMLENLLAENNRWLFKNIIWAKKFANLFLTLNIKYYTDLLDAIMYLAVGDLLKYALKQGYLDLASLYTTDEQVLKKIKEQLNQDKKLALLWRRMNDKNSIGVSTVNYDAEIFCKSRIVDPLFKDGDKIRRLSEAEPSWKDVVEQELKPKRYLLKYNY